MDNCGNNIPYTRHTSNSIIISSASHNKQLFSYVLNNNVNTSTPTPQTPTPTSPPPPQPHRPHPYLTAPHPTTTTPTPPPPPPPPPPVKILAVIWIRVLTIVSRKCNWKCGPYVSGPDQIESAFPIVHTTPFHNLATKVASEAFLSLSLSIYIYIYIYICIYTCVCTLTSNNHEWI